MNFIEAFREWIGTTECPEQFIRYAAFSLLAAAVGNRVYFERRNGNIISPLFLNLYTVLIGPSGAGKSFAMNQVRTILKEADRLAVEEGRTHTRYNFFAGRITNAGLYDLMQTSRRVELPDGTKKVVDIPALSQVYIMMDEMRHDIGHPDHVDQLMSALTQMAFPNDFDDMTRTGGRKAMKDYAVNLIAGTTLDWLIAALDKTALSAGTMNRMVMVKGNYGDLHYPGDSVRPDNWESLFNFLAARVDYLLDLRCAYRLSPAAAEIDRRWYMQQEVPTEDSGSTAVHNRKHSLTHKLATLIELAQEARPMGGEVGVEALIEAQEMADEIIRWQDELAPAILKGEVHSSDDYLLNLIRTSGSSGTAHSWLLKKALARFGMDTDRFTRMARTWEDAGLIMVETKPRSKGGVRYYSPEGWKEYSEKETETV